MSTKKLYRNQEAAIIAGVIAGLADYTGHDVNLWRLVAIALLLMSGVIPGVILYLCAWYLLPVAKQKIADSESVNYED